MQLFRLAAAVVLVSASVVPMSAQAEASPTCFGRPATIVGTDGDDVIRGTDGSDVIVTGAGADLIRGRAGNDFICAGDNPWRPNQSIEDPYKWTDRVFAGDGKDTVDGGPSANEIHGGKGRDILFAGGELPLSADFCQRVYGSAGNDVLYGSPGSDCLKGKAGNDVAFAGGGDDGVFGGDGDDQLSGGSGDDSGDGGPGDDRIRLGRGDDNGYGGMGADIVSGGPGDDVLYGLKFFPRGPEPRPRDQGGNVLRGQAGADRLDGGAGQRNRNLGGTGFDRCRNPAEGQGALGCERDW